ncbi:hypothetical protein [Nonomuraea sp. NPDC003804]|uniref:hypothetical protein n=1 Tax=Nonomuraea sp. NPDC003804 TaxID=3154547 RepID=UPI0033B13795
MARPKIRVRSKTNGLVTEIAPEALRHFPDYEPIDAAPDAVFVEPALPPAETAETPKTTRRSTAAKTEEE